MQGLTTLFVPDRRIELDDHHGSPAQDHRSILQNPTFTGNPPDSPAGTAIHERAGIFFGATASPRLKPLSASSALPGGDSSTNVEAQPAGEMFRTLNARTCTLRCII